MLGQNLHFQLKLERQDRPRYGHLHKVDVLTTAHWHEEYPVMQQTGKMKIL